MITIQTILQDTQVFAAAAGTPPPLNPQFQGQWAVNETSNEEWFVNSSLLWQQIVKQ